MSSVTKEMFMTGRGHTSNLKNADKQNTQDVMHLGTLILFNFVGWLTSCMVITSCSKSLNKGPDRKLGKVGRRKANRPKEKVLEKVDILKAEPKKGFVSLRLGWMAAVLHCTPQRSKQYSIAATQIDDSDDKSEFVDYEKKAADEGVIVQPSNVKHQGNIDDTYNEMRLQFEREIEALKSDTSKSIVVKDDPKAKVHINEKKCVVFETNDQPTVDEQEDLDESVRDLY
uniref:Uncharacterized protein n=1 Tax=Heterorhabditis bacteriophora TaxID=37862 RepID=A0A1I7X6M6_HETBA